MKFWLVGGISSKYATLNTKIGKKYNTNSASIDILDFENKSIESYFRYIPDKSIRSEDLGKDIRFTSATIHDGLIYLCTPTEVCIFLLQDMKLVKRIDHISFNDVHHVNRLNNNILVANTGLDSIMVFDYEYNLKDIFSTNEVSVWDKFDKKVDYRKIASTKPHVNHPNFVFTIDDQIWATRFHNMDAVNIKDRSQKISIEVGKPHDGHVFGDEVYFTTINGWVVIADKNTLEVKQKINLNDLDDRNRPLGWCRSLAKVDRYLYVGFTRLRRTKIEQNLRWIREKFSGQQEPLPARIVKYDLERMCMEDEYIIPEGYTDLIFSIIPV